MATPSPKREDSKVEATTELKRLLGGIHNGQGLDIVDNGVVVGRLQRVEAPLAEEEAALAIRQHAAIDKLLAELDALPEEPEPDDGLSGSKDHDQILYGRPL